MRRGEEAIKLIDWLIDCKLHASHFELLKLALTTYWLIFGKLNAGNFVLL